VFFPAALKVLHPETILGGVRKIYDNFYEIISISDSADSPMSLNPLRFITGRPEVLNDFKNCFRKPFGRNLTPVIELEW